MCQMREMVILPFDPFFLPFFFPTKNLVSVLVFPPPTGEDVLWVAPFLLFFFLEQFPPPLSFRNAWHSCGVFSWMARNGRRSYILRKPAASLFFSLPCGFFFPSAMVSMLPIGSFLGSFRSQPFSYLPVSPFVTSDVWVCMSSLEMLGCCVPSRRSPFFLSPPSDFFSLYTRFVLLL